MKLRDVLADLGRPAIPTVQRRSPIQLQILTSGGAFKYIGTEMRMREPTPDTRTGRTNVLVRGERGEGTSDFQLISLHATQCLPVDNLKFGQRWGSSDPLLVSGDWARQP